MEKLYDRGIVERHEATGPRKVGQSIGGQPTIWRSLLSNVRKPSRNVIPTVNGTKEIATLQDLRDF